MLAVIICASALLVIIVLWAITTSNNLIAKRNRVSQCRSGICVVLKQRNDLLPNLVSTVKQYMHHESEVLTKIAELRSHFGAASEQEQIQRGTRISSLISKLQVAVEQYPELQADDSFRHLREQIVDMEDELQAIRRTCNAAITDYNNYIQMFPSSIIASWRGHTPEDLLDFPEEEMRQVHVSDFFGDTRRQSSMPPVPTAPVMGMPDPVDDSDDALSMDGDDWDDDDWDDDRNGGWRDDRDGGWRNDLSMDRDDSDNDSDDDR